MEYRVIKCQTNVGQNNYEIKALIYAFTIIVKQGKIAFSRVVLLFDDMI